LNGIGFHIDRHDWDNCGSFCGSADGISSDDDENTDPTVDQLPDQFWQSMRITLAGSGKDGLSIDIAKTPPFPLEQRKCYVRGTDRNRMQISNLAVDWLRPKQMRPTSSAQRGN
jgi:hypothetical protein